MEFEMSAVSYPGLSQAAPLPRYGFILMAIAIGLIYLVGFEGGPVSSALGEANLFLHELFHDGRHLIGVPCH
jgi:hypothetical protein